MERRLLLDLAAGVGAAMTSSTSSPNLVETPILRVEDVQMRFRNQAVLRAIELNIRPAETLCVIGESGCGKTVLLKLLIGLLHPTSGRVEFDGHDLSRLSDAELTRIRLRYGFLFQMAALFDSLTVFDNVAFGLREHQLYDESTIARIVMERLQEV